MPAQSVAAPTRVALVGINDRARRLILPGLAAAPRATLVAVCSRDRAKARETATSLGPDVRGYDSLSTLLGSKNVDALYVNTPVESHVDVCLAVLRAGCAVICEKPLAPSSREAEMLVREAERAGVRTAVNFTYRSVPGCRTTERWLAERGSIPLGRPLHARFELLQGHNFLPDFARATAMLDSGSHLFDLMQGLLAAAGFGAITTVSATPLAPNRTFAAAQASVADTVGVVNEPDYGWTFSAWTSEGVAVSALFSRSALGWRNGFRWTLAGEARAIEVELDSDRTVARTVTRGEGAPYGTWQPLDVPADIKADDARFAAYHLDRLVGAIRGEEVFPDFAAALTANRVAEALAASARRGTWVTI
jgi:predicted dehydrogenase